MKRIMIAVFSILILPGALAAQTEDPFSYFSVETSAFSFFEGVNKPPRGSIIVYGSALGIGDYIHHNDADWYYNDLPRGRPRRSRPEVWSSLEHAQVQNQTADVFEEALGELTWDEYLQRDDTLIKVTANGNVIYVLNEHVLHVIEMSSNIVITIDYLEGVDCLTLAGGMVPTDLRSDLILVVRCYHILHLAFGHIEVRSMKDAASIKSSVLQTLNALSPFEDEKTYLSAHHYLNPPEIWIYERPADDSSHGRYVKLDDMFDLGVRDLRRIAFGEDIIRLEFNSIDYSFDQAAKLRTRIAIMGSLERILSANGKWLLEVSSWGEPILIRNLSNMYVQGDKQ